MDSNVKKENMLKKSSFDIFLETVMNDFQTLGEAYRSPKKTSSYPKHDIFFPFLGGLHLGLIRSGSGTTESITVNPDPKH